MNPRNYIRQNRQLFLSFGVCILFALTLVMPAYAAEKPSEMSPQAKPVEHDPKVFSPDPSYEEKKYDAPGQIDIYGGKSRFDEVRPILELGRPIYLEGPFEKGINILGRKNAIYPGFHVSGDWRTAVGYNENGAVETGLVATRLNLDLDLRLTGTERIHATMTPLNQGGNFTQKEFFGDDRDNDFELRKNLNLDALFFEGDVGTITQGLSDSYNLIDLPFSFGLMPLLFQNGVWFEDAFIGGAFAIPAMSSPKLGISNMDITVFGGFDKVTTPAVLDDAGALADHSLSIYGATTYIEANEGYWEAGIGRLDGEDDFDELSYNSATLAFTKRYGRRLSNSLRTIYTFGQDRNNAQQTADGWMFIAENSLVTSLPSTLVPYANFWLGLDRPQPLADGTGLLKNTGITFDTNALTGLPKLDDTGHDTWGGAIGIEYLFNLDQQIVFEMSALQIMGDANELGRAAVDDQYGLGFRWQLPISRSWILRADAMYGALKGADDIAGASVEMRYKF